MAISRKASVLLIAASFQYPPTTLFCSSFSVQQHHRKASFHHPSPSHSKRKLIPLQLFSTNVNVYDNIFDNEACSLLHDLAVDHSERCHGSCIFRRTPQHTKQLTPLEKAMDTILEALNDTSPVVEYWSRSSYINMDAHADIDENTLKRDGVLRCPRNAHVLYMRVANSGDDIACADHERIRRMGPTIVFPKKKVSWGAVTSIAVENGQAHEEEYIVDVENYWDDETRLQHGLARNMNPTSVDMVVVPALNGRLLRFDGRAFHAVPKPPHRYLMSEEELDEYMEGEQENCPDENFWDDDFEEDQEMERSVLLFNTWPHESSGPRGVLPDRVVVDIPDGVVIEGGVDDAFQIQMEEERRRDWQEEYGVDFESVWCNGIEKWECVPVERTSNDVMGNIVVPLMGNSSRRGCNFKQDLLKGPINGLEQKFYDS
ncbi:hypothetical protein ACHAWX_002845, partial [Stephanocyclus meneghinianus]